MNRIKFTKQEISWILYDVANSAYSMALTAIIPIYFVAIAEMSGVNETQSMGYWGITTSISIVIIAILSPILGALADFEGKKKKFFLSFLIFGVALFAMLAFVDEWIAFLVLVILSRICYTACNVFYDAMLTDVSDEDRVDTVSSHGFAWGYIGSCIPFVIGVFLITALPFGLTTPLAIKIYLVITSAWWLIMSIPLIKNVHQRYYKKPEPNYIRSTIKELFNTLTSIKNNKRLLFFILAYFFYIDGVNTIISMATIYGTALGLDSTGLIIALLVTQIVAFPASIVSGMISKKFGNTVFLKVAILAYMVICILGFKLSTVSEFFFLAICIGLMQGGIQALSRSHFSKLIPREKSSEYFGFFSVFGKFAEVLGPLLISLSVFLFNVPNYGLLFLIGLFILGFILFSMSEKYKN